MNNWSIDIEQKAVDMTQSWAIQSIYWCVDCCWQNKHIHIWKEKNEEEKKCPSIVNDEF